MDEWEALLPLLERAEHPFYFFSSHATAVYSDIPFGPDDWLIFGSETSGLPQVFLDRWPERFYRIPMLPNRRCLNLATSAGIVLYEALRQQQFSIF